MPTAILRLPAVKARTGLSRSSIYLRMAKDMFPPQVKVGPRAVGWVESEIEMWVSSQIEQSRSRSGRRRRTTCPRVGGLT